MNLIMNLIMLKVIILLIVRFKNLMESRNSVSVWNLSGKCLKSLTRCDETDCSVHHLHSEMKGYLLCCHEKNKQAWRWEGPLLSNKDCALHEPNCNFCAYHLWFKRSQRVHLCWRSQRITAIESRQHQIGWAKYPMTALHCLFFPRLLIVIFLPSMYLFPFPF